jgi:hypothetical protein
VSLYTVLSSGGRIAMRGVDLAISSRFTWLVTGTGLAYFAADPEFAAGARRKNGNWSNPLPEALTMGTAVGYAAELALLGTGLGRYPLSGRLVAYSVSQAFIAVADGYILGRITVRPNNERRPLAFPFVMIWFGCRLLDGWYRASMPIDTLPFASLMAKTRLGRDLLSPSLIKMTAWVNATAFLSRMVHCGAAVGRVFMKVADLVISSRVAWLVYGIATTCFVGTLRACALQNQRLKELVPCTKDNTPHPMCPSTREGEVVKRMMDAQNACKNALCALPHHNHSDGTRRHIVGCRLATWEPESSLTMRRWIVGGPLSAGMLAGYGAILLLGATAAGRVPLSARSLGYVIGQVGAKWVDGVAFAKCFVGRLDCDGEGKALPEFWNGYYASTPWMAAGLVYFGLRAVDGYMMASQPMNTLPWLSLGSRLLSVRS